MHKDVCTDFIVSVCVRILICMHTKSNQMCCVSDVTTNVLMATVWVHQCMHVNVTWAGQGQTAPQIVAVTTTLIVQKVLAYAMTVMTGQLENFANTAGMCAKHFL